MPRARRIVEKVEPLDVRKFPRPLGIRPQPQFEESLSSWTARLCLAIGCDLRTFSTKLLNERITVWNNDIDKKLGAEAVSRLAAATAVSENRVRQMALEAYEGITFRSLPRYGSLPWVLPRYSFKGLAAPASLGLFCPDCMAQDRVPYFRRYWRLSFFTFCPRHGRLLFDGCPNCGNPVGPLQRDFSAGADSIPPVHVCSFCGTDLRTLAGQGKQVPNTPATVGYFRLLGDIAFRRRKKPSRLLPTFELLSRTTRHIIDPWQRILQKRKKVVAAANGDIMRRYNLIARFFAQRASVPEIVRFHLPVRDSLRQGAHGA